MKIKIVSEAKLKELALFYKNVLKKKQKFEVSVKEIPDNLKGIVGSKYEYLFVSNVEKKEFAPFSSMKTFWEFFYEPLFYSDKKVDELFKKHDKKFMTFFQYISQWWYVQKLEKSLTDGQLLTIFKLYKNLMQEKGAPIRDVRVDWGSKIVFMGDEIEYDKTDLYEPLRRGIIIGPYLLVFGPNGLVIPTPLYCRSVIWCLGFDHFQIKCKSSTGYVQNDPKNNRTRFVLEKAVKFIWKFNTKFDYCQTTKKQEMMMKKKQSNSYGFTKLLFRELSEDKIIMNEWWCSDGPIMAAMSWQKRIEHRSFRSLKKAKGGKELKKEFAKIKELVNKKKFGVFDRRARTNHEELRKTVEKWLGVKVSHVDVRNVYVYEKYLVMKSFCLSLWISKPLSGDETKGEQICKCPPQIRVSKEKESLEKQPESEQRVRSSFYPDIERFPQSKVVR